MAKRIGSWLGLLLAVGLLGGSVLFTSVPVAWAGSTIDSVTVSGSASLGLDCFGSVAISVPYHAQVFTVDTSGSYDLLNVSNGFDSSNSFFLLYHDAYEPDYPLGNCITSNNDSGGDRRAAITWPLNAGTTYICVGRG